MAPVPTLTALVETEKRRRSKTRSRTIARRRTALRASRCATTRGPALATCTACTAPIISPEESGHLAGGLPAGPAVGFRPARPGVDHGDHRQGQEDHQGDGDVDAQHHPQRHHHEGAEGDQVVGPDHELRRLVHVVPEAADAPPPARRGRALAPGRRRIPASRFCCRRAMLVARRGRWSGRGRRARRPAHGAERQQGQDPPQPAPVRPPPAVPAGAGARPGRVSKNSRRQRAGAASSRKTVVMEKTLRAHRRGRKRSRRHWNHHGCGRSAPVRSRRRAVERGAMVTPAPAPCPALRRRALKREAGSAARAGAGPAPRCAPPPGSGCRPPAAPSPGGGR